MTTQHEQRHQNQAYVNHYFVINAPNKDKKVIWSYLDDDKFFFAFTTLKGICNKKCEVFAVTSLYMLTL